MTSDTEFTYRISATNRGKAEATNARNKYVLLLADETLSVDEEIKALKGIENDLIKSRSSTLLVHAVYPGESLNLGRGSITLGRKLVYIFAGIEYEGGDLEKRQYFLSEFCAYIDKDRRINQCHTKGGIRIVK